MQKWILIADDEPELLDIYEAVLSEFASFKIVLAKDGAEAYSKSRNQQFDLILTDYRMPKLNGVKFIEAIRENELNEKTPIYVITGYADEVFSELKQNRINQNIKVLEKPVAIDTLKQIAFEIQNYEPAVQKNQFTIDVDFLNPYMTAVEITLKDMAHLDLIKAGKPFLLQTDSQIKIDISSNMSILSEHFSGNIIIGFPQNTFLKVASKILGEEQKIIDNNNCDLVSELTNIIFGKAKKNWADNGFAFQKVIPSIVLGEDHKLNINRDTPMIVVPYETSEGIFNAIITVHKYKSLSLSFQ